MSQQPGTTVPKAVYALYYAALACLVPFMTLYYQQRGLSGAQIGVLSGIIPLVTLAGSPFWSGVADSTRRHRAVLVLTIGGLCMSVLALSFATTFATLLLSVLLYAFFVGPIVPLIDNAVLDLLGERKADYGRVRVWGSVGWATGAIVIGPLLERLGLAWSFYGFLAFMALCMVVAYRLPIGLGDAGVGVNYRDGLGILLRNSRFLLLLAVALLYGIGIGVLLSYQFLYLESLGASRTLMSVTLVASTVSEMPFWFLGGTLLRRFGVNRMIVLSLVATLIRMFGLAFIGAPWLAVPISLLHGPSFAVLWTAGVAASDAAAPPGLGATAQGLFSAAMTGLGAALGGFLGGPGYEALGFSTLFALIGWLTVGALALFVGTRRLMRTNEAAAKAG